MLCTIIVDSDAVAVGNFELIVGIMLDSGGYWFAKRII